MFADSNMDLGQKNRITLLRVIPAVAFYLILVLAFYLIFFPAFFVAFYLTFLPAFYLTSILTYFLTFWHSIVKFFLTFFLAFYLASILTFRLAFFLAFKSRRAPQHPELAIWWSRPSVSHSICAPKHLCPTASGAGNMVSGAHSTVQKEDRSDGSKWRKEGRKEGGVAHLLKSRGRHLAGREILGKYKCSTPTFWTTWLPFRA